MLCWPRPRIDVGVVAGQHPPIEHHLALECWLGYMEGTTPPVEVCTDRVHSRAGVVAAVPDPRARVCNRCACPGPGQTWLLPGRHWRHIQFGRAFSPRHMQLSCPPTKHHRHGRTTTHLARPTFFLAGMFSRPSNHLPPPPPRHHPHLGPYCNVDIRGGGMSTLALLSLLFCFRHFIYFPPWPP